MLKLWPRAPNQSILLLLDGKLVQIHGRRDLKGVVGCHEALRHLTRESQVIQFSIRQIECCTLLPEFKGIENAFVVSLELACLGLEGL